MLRLLALDLDGTLTNSRKEITPRTRDVLLRAQQQGVRIVLASGRPTAGIMPLARELKLERYGGYIMAFNGGLTIECATGHVIHQQLLTPDLYPYLYQKGCTQDFQILSYLNDAIASEDIDNPYVRYEASLNRMPLLKLDNFLQTINFPEPKCLIVGDPDKLAVLEQEMSLHLQGRMSVYRSEPFFLELVPLGIDKASCLQVLLTHLGLDKSQLMACGDGFNDLSMIRFAGLGVAMANAQQAVKDAADCVTLSNEEDGVAVAVERFVLGGE